MPPDGPPSQVTESSSGLMAWSEDLFITPRLQDVACRLGYRLTVIDNPAQLGAEGVPPDRPVPLTEPLEGPDGRLVEALTLEHPAMILADTASETLPWARWIQVLKTSAATRRIPIVAFGPHVDQARLDRARQAGADLVVSRGKLQASLPQLIEVWARVTSAAELEAGCLGPLSDWAVRGIELHRTGAYFEAHEALEEAWLEAPEVEGQLYRALLQVSVAYYHAERGNHRGASKMMLRIRQWLDPLPDACRGIDVAGLRDQVESFRQALKQLTPETMDQLDRRLLRPFPQLDSA
jgi:predicted metal-dependent hydrolase